MRSETDRLFRGEGQVREKSEWTERVKPDGQRLAWLPSPSRKIIG
jgi:hypothetical protein